MEKLIGSRKQLEKNQTEIYVNVPEDINDGLPEIDEDAGEILCDVCEGRGCVASEYDPNLSSVCWKCQGDGKLDWLSFITGKPVKMSASSSGTSGCVGTSGVSGSSGTVGKLGYPGKVGMPDITTVSPVVFNRKTGMFGMLSNSIMKYFSGA